ncbi:hypothetical protein B0H11DRAFT_2209372 [Mycena galericulata]|nr:hypothetical protein B0H11DRAFT_2209372 [Mycena galericulata]
MKYNGAEMLGTLRTIATARTRSFHTSPRGSRIQGQLQRTKPPIPQRQVLRKQEVQPDASAGTKKDYSERCIRNGTSQEITVF